MIQIFYTFFFIDTGVFTPHSEWEMLSAKQIRTSEYPHSCDNPFTIITLVIKIRRRPLFHIIHLIIPMVLVALLSLLSFSIPSKSGMIAKQFSTPDPYASKVDSN